MQLRLAEADADEGRREVSDRRERLEQPEGVGPRAIGHHLRHERHAHGELSADSQSRDEPVEGEVDESPRQCRQPGTERIDHDRDHHRLGAAEPVADDAEDETAGGPAEHEDAGGEAAVEVDLAFEFFLLLRGHRLRVERLGSKERLHGGLAGQREELLVEAVEEPSERRHDEHEPVVAGQPLPPGPSVVGRRGGRGGEVRQVGHDVSRGEGWGKDRENVTESRGGRGEPAGPAAGASSRPRGW